jgi:hypothetical protein
MLGFLELYTYIFSGFWVFLGSILILTMVFHFIFSMWNRFWRHWNIRKHGYPPIHCDADGDFKKEEEI